ncbi:MAG: glycosyltransferase family 4 protein [Deltaproteobacteria bacterium]|nr:glycosyltransferase family 4 protein [Deltaproteobacteria bacterium]
MSKPARILFVGPDLKEVGGVSSYCKAILDESPTIDYFGFPVKMKSKPLLFARVLFRFMKKLRSTGDVVHFNTSLNFSAIARDAIFMLVSLLHSRKVIVFIHGWDIPFQKSLRGIRLFMFKSVFNRAKSICVLGKVFKEELVRWGFDCRIEVGYYCFVNEAASVRARAYSRESETGPRILYLSRIVKEKGAFELADACGKLKEDYPGVVLDIAGDGPDLAELKEYARKRNYDFITFHGNVTGAAKAALFESANLFSLPTYYGEGFPLAITEAASFGLPVVTTRAGGIPDIFTDNKNGFFVEPGDADDLYAKIDHILSDQGLWESISSENVRFVKRYFSPDLTARRFAQLYMECLSD